QTTGTQFVGQQLTGGTCVGCHALSADGNKLVAEAGGQNDGRILLMDVLNSVPLVPFAQPGKSIFESWDPTGKRYVGVYGDTGATDFNLLLFDGATGAQLGDIPNTGSDTNPADHPDWSPDGSRIVYDRVGIKNTLQMMYRASIRMVRDMGGGTWSPPIVIVP